MKKLCEMLMNRKVLIGLAIVMSVIIISVILTMNSMGQPSSKKEEFEMIRYPELPGLVNDELDRIYLEKPFTVNRWEIDENKKNITLYGIDMTTAQINELQNKQVGEWTVTAVPDTEMMKEIEVVREEMRRLEQDPEMQLATYEMHIGHGRIEIFVYLFNYTPKNRELLKNGIRGWKVDGGAITTPSRTPTGTMP